MIIVSYCFLYNSATGSGLKFIVGHTFGHTTRNNQAGARPSTGRGCQSNNSLESRHMSDLKEQLFGCIATKKIVRYSNTNEQIMPTWPCNAAGGEELIGDKRGQTVSSSCIDTLLHYILCSMPQRIKNLSYGTMRHYGAITQFVDIAPVQKWGLSNTCQSLFEKHYTSV